nr:MAG TPA: hypothetical protein [Caudoviricetes sp.]
MKVDEILRASVCSLARVLHISYTCYHFHLFLSRISRISRKPQRTKSGTIFEVRTQISAEQRKTRHS